MSAACRLLLDRLPYFTEYVRNLNNDESTQVLGVTLPMLNRRSEGVYAEEETTPKRCKENRCSEKTRAVPFDPLSV